MTITTRSHSHPIHLNLGEIVDGLKMEAPETCHRHKCVGEWPTPSKESLREVGVVGDISSGACSNDVLALTVDE